MPVPWMLWDKLTFDEIHTDGFRFIEILTYLMPYDIIQEYNWGIESS